MQHAVYATQQDGMLRPMETEASDMPSQKPGAEHVEMEQLPEEEFLNSWVKARHYMKVPFAEFLAVSLHCTPSTTKVNYTNIPISDFSRRAHRSQRHTRSRNRRSASRHSTITELVLGSRLHDRYLPSRWHLQCSPKPRHPDRPLDIPRLSRPTMLLLRDSTSSRCNRGSWSDILHLPRRYHELRTPCICRKLRVGILYRAAWSC